MSTEAVRLQKGSFPRRVFCNRTLNLRAIQAIGYDMDYTLVHYRVFDWEGRAYAYTKERLSDFGWPLSELRFVPEMMIRGLVIDTELGNIVKADRFGFVKQAFHGTKALEFEDLRAVYARTTVDLSKQRFQFLNTLFSISEGCLYAQLVDLADQHALPGVMGYGEIYKRVRKAVDETHFEGELKAEITANPDRFVELDPELALALLDQQHSGKKLMLITNSDYTYTRSMMSYALDRFLPGGKSWRDLFEVVIVDSRKPAFFEDADNPLLEVVTDDGLLRPAKEGLLKGRIFSGGSATAVERFLGVAGDQILYLGDHIFGDVNVSKNILRWRTGLVLRELEDDLVAEAAFHPTSEELTGLMKKKVALEVEYNQLRVEGQRVRSGYGPPPTHPAQEAHERLNALRAEMIAIDERISPLAKAASRLSSPLWGPCMRAGNDKSHLARQVERYADIYTSRVSNLLYETPYVYLRSPRGKLPHDL